MNNDKKKMMVLGALGLVLVAVGAFTFIGGGSPPPPTTTAATTKDGAGEKGKDGEEAAKELSPGEKLVAQFSAGELPTRDPFSAPEVKPEKPIVADQPIRPVASGRGSGGGRRSIGGNLPPFDPTGGAGIGGGLPSPGGNIGLEPGAALDDPGYRVTGVIQGRKPMAVLEDGNGNQKLVPVGGSVDGDTQVTGIEKGKVRVRHRGKEKTLDLDGGK